MLRPSTWHPMLEVRSVKGFGCWPVVDLYSRGEGRRPKAFTKSVAHLQIREMGARGTEKPAGNPHRYRRQSMILMPLPHPTVSSRDAAGLRL